MFNEIYFGVALFAPLLVYMLDYAFGQPGNEKWNDKELLSGWSFLLAKRRLKKDNAWQQKFHQLNENLLKATNAYDRKMILKGFKQAVFIQARETFYWEKAIGMCPICFHFWVSLFLFSVVNYFYLQVNIFYFTLYLLFSHLIIRLLKKFV